jgi:ATP-dependent RNA helicase SUPV3L1/SUV3
MTPLNTRFDVAVLDKIQMIADPTRGWALTQTFLVLQCPEVHLCGELNVIPLFKSLSQSTEDMLHIHEYKRLSSLASSKELEKYTTWGLHNNVHKRFHISK